MTETQEKTLADVVAELDQERRAKAKTKEELEQRVGEHDDKITRLRHDIELMAGNSNLTPAQIELAQSVVFISGKIEESAEGAFEKALNAIAHGGNGLRQEYIGAKRYEHFHQGVTCEYGYAPTHGSVVFAVGLTDEARRRPLGAPDGRVLTPEEADAAVRWLLAEKKVAEERVRASHRRW